MATEQPESQRRGRSYLFHEKAIPSPPGTKFKGKHLLPGEDPWAMNRRWWLVTVGAVAAALLVGLLAGRFLLP
jgi:hypothetical protein